MTPKVTITLEEPLAGAAAEEFGRRIYFATGDILDFRFVTRDDLVTAVDLTLAPTGHPETVTRKVKAILDNDVLAQLIRPPKVIWSSPTAVEISDGTFARLRERGEVFPAGEGQVSLGPAMLHLMDALDDVVRGIVIDELGGIEYRYPTLISARTMHRCGYLTSFPQYLMFAARLHSDLDVYQRFVDDTRAAGQLVPNVLDRCSDVDYCLPPTMCYHTFAQYADRELPPGLRTVTAKGKSFRHEQKYHRGLERLWDFTIRETVFFGSREQVLTRRRWFLDRILRLLEQLQLSGRCEVANDPFFGNTDVAVSSSSQRLLELKYEIRLEVGGGRDIAVGSFNFHERAFGTAFAITLPDGETPFTACTGFGLERLAYAVACQYGVEPDAWPDHVRAVLGPNG
ncbi:hypothetical protein [Micromonospora echinofusca]|uniref:Aminoacyl-transfer RNA synthetases class-II family profile domain-containing protein n=1 Tax=Micromonospora echinofusca TaxID=47858 RepID=A0ABS3VIR6_MICEH|nr:hypothetical protein [Micromonospora echinofusca]MBO4204429.1 hypothetical protein [Micromonospora echinofusca]